MIIYRNQVKSVVGWAILVGHATILAYVFLGKSDVWTFNQQWTVALTVAPVTAVYFSAVVKNFIQQGSAKELGGEVNLNYAGVSIVIPVSLFCLVLYVIQAYPSQQLDDVDTLQKVVAGAETMLGGVVGYVVDNLFPRT